MISTGIILFITILILQVLVILLEPHFQTALNNVKKLNSIHEMLKTLSFLPLSRHTMLHDEIKSLVNLVTVHNQFNGCSLCIKSKDKDSAYQIYRFSETAGINQPDLSEKPSFQQKTNLTQVEDTRLTKLETDLISRIQNQPGYQPESGQPELQVVDKMPDFNENSASCVSDYEKKLTMAVVSPLILQAKEIGFLIWFSFKQIPIDNYTRDALQVVSATTTMLIQSSAIFSKLSTKEQIQAVNNSW